MIVIEEVRCVARFCFALVIGLLCTLAVGNASSENLIQGLDADLSRADVAHIISTIREHKDPVDQRAIADWIKARVDDGTAPDQFAQSVAVISLKAGQREDALMYLDYFRALLRIDSSICSDPSSGGSLIEATIFLFGSFTRDKSITIELRQEAADRAIALEAATSMKRRVDPSLCHSGLTAYA